MKQQTGKFLEGCRVVSGKLASSRDCGFNGLFRIPLFAEIGNPDGGPHIDCIVSDGGGWDHISVVVHGDGARCPTWEEMCKVKDLFFAEHETVLQYHPAKTKNISFHPYCLHLWRPQNGVVPVPPGWMVAPEPTADQQAQLAALCSDDEQTIRSYFIGRGVRMPDNPIAFWSGVHKARMNVPFVPDDVRNASRAWLNEHGKSERVITQEIEPFIKKEC